MKCRARALCVSVCLIGVAAGPLHAVPGPGKVAHFHFTGVTPESPAAPNPFELMFNPDRPGSFKELLDRFKKARDDDAVKAVLLTFENMGMGVAQMQELRQAIAQVRAADKDVYVHTEQMATLHLLLFSAASHISMVPTGDLWLTGMYAEALYVKGTLDKLGIEAAVCSRRTRH